MTSLVEKSLITGFGIFTLIVFISLITPFFNKIDSFDSYEENDLDDYNDFIESIENAINFIILNPYEDFKDYILYPESLNISFFQDYVRFDYSFKNNIYNKILQYDEEFFPISYKNMPNQGHMIYVIFKDNLITVNITLYKSGI